VALSGIALVTGGAGFVGSHSAAALGVRERAGEPILTTVGRVVGTTQRLLVLDNCEHLSEEVAALVGPDGPAAVLTGGEGALEDALVQYAQAHGYHPARLANGLMLWLK